MCNFCATFLHRSMSSMKLGRYGLYLTQDKMEQHVSLAVAEVKWKLSTCLFLQIPDILDI